MAKSKSGGTRSYIRGRVGADVYSIGKDAQGKKQQVVRSLAESVANPQTQSQMRGRMIMSTVMQAVAALKPIIDHSFDNVTGRQPNISEFIARNYALVKADVLAHPSSANAFGLNKYQEKGVKRGAYIIADGDAQLPSTLVLTKASGSIAITMAADAVTIAGLKSALGMTSEEYFTLVGITADGKANYERFRVNPTLADSTAISSSNIGDVFAVEGNAAASVSVASNVITITLAAVANCCAVIISKKVSGGYVHNEAILGSLTGVDFNADAALPTYPVGAQDYLNGGDIFGQQESFNPAPTPTPTPTPSVSAPSINGTTPFETSTSVTMSAESGAEIRYTTDGSQPSANSTLYSAAITLTETTTIKAIAIKDGVSSEVATSTFTKSSSPSSDLTMTVNGQPTEINSQYDMSADSVVVLNVPEGSEFIGMQLGEQSAQSAYPTSVTLVAGANTINLEKSHFSTNRRSWGIGKMEQSGFEYTFKSYQLLLWIATTN